MNCYSIFSSVRFANKALADSCSHWMLCTLSSSTARWAYAKLNCFIQYFAEILGSETRLVCVYHPPACCGSGGTETKLFYLATVLDFRFPWTLLRYRMAQQENVAIVTPMSVFIWLTGTFNICGWKYVRAALSAQNANNGSALVQMFLLRESTLARAISGTKALILQHHVQSWRWLFRCCDFDKDKLHIVSWNVKKVWRWNSAPWSSGAKSFFVRVSGNESGSQSMTYNTYDNDDEVIGHREIPASFQGKESGPGPACHCMLLK